MLPKDIQGLIGPVLNVNRQDQVLKGLINRLIQNHKQQIISIANHSSSIRNRELLKYDLFLAGRVQYNVAAEGGCQRPIFSIENLKEERQFIHIVNLLQDLAVKNKMSLCFLSGSNLFVEKRIICKPIHISVSDREDQITFGFVFQFEVEGDGVVGVDNIDDGDFAAVVFGNDVPIQIRVNLFLIEVFHLGGVLLADFRNGDRRLFWSRSRSRRFGRCFRRLWSRCRVCLFATAGKDAGHQNQSHNHGQNADLSFHGVFSFTFWSSSCRHRGSRALPLWSHNWGYHPPGGRFFLQPSAADAFPSFRIPCQC